jgi:hypothetical protein
LKVPFSASPMVVGVAVRVKDEGGMVQKGWAGGIKAWPPRFLPRLLGGCPAAFPPARPASRPFLRS